MALRKSELDPSRYGDAPAWTISAVVASSLLHGLLYASLSTEVFAQPREKPRSSVAFQVITTPKPEAEPEPEPQARELLEPSVVPQNRVQPQKLAEAPIEPRPAADPATEPVDLSGITLTNDSDSGFAMPTGNGLARTGALRVPASIGRRPPLSPDSRKEKPAGPPLVAVSALSMRPTPPSLDSALERNYPDEARRRGLGGNALVRLRIDPDGIVRTLTPLSESFPGFGEACRRTLRGSRWSPPLDQSGRAVATEVRYTCRFVVSQ